MGRRNIILRFFGKLVAFLKSPFLVLAASLRFNKVTFVAVSILLAAFVPPVFAQDKSADEGNIEQVATDQLVDISPVIIDGASSLMSLVYRCYRRRSVRHQLSRIF